MGMFDWISDGLSSVGNALGLTSSDENKPQGYDPNADRSEPPPVHPGPNADLGQYNKDLAAWKERQSKALIDQGAYGRDVDWRAERAKAEAGTADSIAAQAAARDALDLSRRRAMGEVPTAAELEGDRQRRALAGDIAARAAGSTSPAAQRSAQYATAQMGADVASSAAAAAARERAAAESAYLGGSQAMYGRELGAEGQRQGASLGLLQGELSNRQAGNKDRSSLALGEKSADAAMYAADQQASAQRFAGTMNAAASGIGAAAGKSDIRAKTDIRPASADPDFAALLKQADAEPKGTIEELLGSLEPSTYRYKNPARDGGGERTGVMAQDLAQSEIGSQLVHPDEEGELSVDYSPQRWGPMSAAALANLHQRLRKLEG